MTTPAIIIEGAHKAYPRGVMGRKEAVSDVSLSVEQGTVHGLLGPNGAGKTTTLKMLLGLVRPTAGRFEILGTPAHARGARRRLGFLAEQPYFPSHLTAAEVMALSADLIGLARAEAKEQSFELLSRVGLDGAETTLLSRYSRGMLQRLGLAQALMGDPSVVVLDEPASGLDPVGQRDVRNLMLDLRAGGTTILLSSHQLSEVEAVCDGVTIMNRGRVAAVGHIDDLLNVAGRTSVKAQGAGELPAPVAAKALDIVTASGTHVFSIPDADVRAVVDALDDAGWRIISVMPKRDSLEDYFTRLVESDATVDGGRR